VAPRWFPLPFKVEGEATSMPGDQDRNTDPVPRHIALGRLCNFRDAGGYRI